MVLYARTKNTIVKYFLSLQYLHEMHPENAQKPHRPIVYRNPQQDETDLKSWNPRVGSRDLGTYADAVPGL